MVQDFLSRTFYDFCADRETINLFFVNFRSSLAKLRRRFPKIGFNLRIDPQIYIGRDPKTFDDELKASEGLEDHRMFPALHQLIFVIPKMYCTFARRPESIAVETAIDAQRTLHNLA